MNKRPNALVSTQSDPSPAPAGSHLLRPDLQFPNNQHQIQAINTQNNRSSIQFRGQSQTNTHPLNNQSKIEIVDTNVDHPSDSTDPLNEKEEDDKDEEQCNNRFHPHGLKKKWNVHTPRIVKEAKVVIREGEHAVGRTVVEVGHTLRGVPVIKQSVSFFSDYRKFIDRGNVVDLAVAVVVGNAFTAIVTSMVTDMITPFIAIASGKNLQENFIILRKSHNETALALGPPKTRAQAASIGDITWNWGNFVQTVINFFITSGCVFLIVKVYESARDKKKSDMEKGCDYCFKSIPLKAARCPNCTTWIDWTVCTKVNDLESEARATTNDLEHNRQSQQTMFPAMEPWDVEIKKRTARSL